MSVLIKGMEMPKNCGDCKAFVCYRQWADLIANSKTNADRIRSMTDEELAEFLDDVRDEWGCSYYPHGTEDWLDWLKQETKE